MKGTGQDLHRHTGCSAAMVLLCFATWDSSMVTESRNLPEFLYRPEQLKYFGLYLLWLLTMHATVVDVSNQKRKGVDLSLNFHNVGQA